MVPTKTTTHMGCSDGIEILALNHAPCCRNTESKATVV